MDAEDIALVVDLLQTLENLITDVAMYLICKNNKGEVLKRPSETQVTRKQDKKSKARSSTFWNVTISIVVQQD